MAYSIDEIKELKAKIDFALTAGRLNAWQMKFLTDIKDRIEKYGTAIRLSGKQVDKLYEITGAGRTFSNVTRLPYSPLRPPRWRPRSYGLLEREGRRLANRLVRNFAIVSVLIVVGIVYSFTQNVFMPTINTYVSTAPRPNSGIPVTNREFTVTDGDTIRMIGEAKGLRLVGFNAPETFDPKCAQELALGNRAKARLKEIVIGGNLELQRIPCSCKPGTEGTEACNHSRSCGILLANGRDVGQTLISEGLAVPFACGSTSCPPTPRPWCT